LFVSVLQNEVCCLACFSRKSCCLFETNLVIRNDSIHSTRSKDYHCSTIIDTVARNAPILASLKGLACYLMIHTCETHTKVCAKVLKVNNKNSNDKDLKEWQHKNSLLGNTTKVNRLRAAARILHLSRQETST
jgi:hypothetical protein